MAAKLQAVKAEGMKHIQFGHYGAKVNGKQVLVKLPANVEKPEAGADMNIFPDWIANELPGLSEVQKEYIAKVKATGGANANDPGE